MFHHKPTGTLLCSRAPLKKQEYPKRFLLLVVLYCETLMKKSRDITLHKIIPSQNRTYVQDLELNKMAYVILYIKETQKRKLW